LNNLVCFPHYTSGGLLCDIFNDTFSNIAKGGINNKAHSIGKIGDSETVFTEFNPEDFIKALADNPVPAGTWIGTHCWPQTLPVELFGRVVNITTATYKSKLYRWARAYYQYFNPQWSGITGMEKTDKMRETAKNYIPSFDPVFADNVENLEFADLVEQTQEFCKVVGIIDAEKHIARWQELNNFLYDPKLWTSDVADAFYQAEFELSLNRFYRYE
jgi:hypothetical protein